MRIDRIHGKLDRTVFRQQPDKVARFEVVTDQESRGKENPHACKRGQPQRYGVRGVNGLPAVIAEYDGMQGRWAPRLACTPTRNR